MECEARSHFKSSLWKIKQITIIAVKVCRRAILLHIHSTSEVISCKLNHCTTYSTLWIKHQSTSTEQLIKVVTTSVQIPFGRTRIYLNLCNICVIASCSVVMLQCSTIAQYESILKGSRTCIIVRLTLNGTSLNSKHTKIVIYSAACEV